MTSRFRLQPDGAKSLIGRGFSKIRPVRAGSAGSRPKERAPLGSRASPPVGRAPIGALYGEIGRNRTAYRKYDV